VAQNGDRLTPSQICCPTSTHTSHTWSSHTTKRRAITMIDNPPPALRKKTHTHTSKTRGDGWNMRTHVEKEGDETHLQLPVLTTQGFILCRNSSLYTEVAMAPTTPTSHCSLVHCKSLESIGEKNPATLAFLQWFLLAICSKIVGESFCNSAPDLKYPATLRCVLSGLMRTRTQGFQSISRRPLWMMRFQNG
jgi:hypothetical protein